MGIPVQYLCIKKGGVLFTDFVNQQVKLEEEDSDHLLSLKHKKFQPIPGHWGTDTHLVGSVWARVLQRDFEGQRL